MLESNLAPKGSPAARLCLIFMLLRLRMSPYAYDYRTCKHPCAYACAYVYAGVVSVNQALGSQGIMLLKSTSAIFFRGSILKPGLHVRRKHKHKHKHNHKKPSCKPVQRKHKRLVLMLASSRFTRTTQRRKHKHKHKRMERFPFSCACVVASYV